MGIFRQFPYSNFHEMNTDEIIKIIKNMLEEWATYHAEWDSWMDEMEDDWSNYQEVMNEAWQNMQDFINNYFDNLDLQEEVNNKIVSMIQTGEFGMLVNEYIPPAVSAWLTLHITEPTGVVIDTSLTVAGACADAKATGDAINDLESELTSDIALVVTEESVPVPLQINTDGYWNIYGNFITEGNRQYAYIDVEPGETYSLDTYITSMYLPAVVFFNEDTFVSSEKVGTGEEEHLTGYRFTIPSGVDKVAVQSAVKKETSPVSVDKINRVSRSYTKAETDEMVDKLDDAVFETYPVDSQLELTINTDGYYNTIGDFVSDAGRAYAIVDNVSEGEVYKLTTYIRSSQIPAIEFFNGSSFVSYLKNGTGIAEFLYGYEFTIPSGVNKLIVQNATVSNMPDAPILMKRVYVERTTFYSRHEIDSSLTGAKYGIKWAVNDPDDLGSRCFSAAGLNATIGIGSNDGESDFDNIFPWSEIKRCSIKTNANGASVVTFEGESGFALDGTNGDVFVRIPKFYVEKYIENGYEYRVVSASGTTPHKAFVENGIELDEIFVGAFESYSDGVSLKSIGGVIPASNKITSTFLSLAKANGDNYNLYDMRCVDAIWTLMIVEFGCRNTNQILGYGYADFLQPTNDQYGISAVVSEANTNTLTSDLIPQARKDYMPIGSNITICKGTQQNVITQAKLVSMSTDGTHDFFTFDGDPVNIDTDCFMGSAGCSTNFCENAPSGALTWHTGRADWMPNSKTRNPVRYRWIENIVGSLWHLLPDTLFQSRQMYMCENMMDYDVTQISDAYKPIGDLLLAQTSNGSKADITGANYWITALLNDIFAKGSCFGKTFDTSLTSTKAFGGYYFMDDSSDLHLIANGGGFDHLYRCNMLTNRAWIDIDEQWYLYGARLIYKRIS